MKKSISCIAAASLLGLAPSAFAAPGDPPDTRFYVAPMASYNFSDSNVFDPDEEIGGQLSLGKNFGDYFALELYAFHYNDMALSSNFGSSANMDVTGYGASALFFPARDILPIFAVVGAGIGTNDFDDFSPGVEINEQDADFYDVGVGYMVPLNDYGVKLRAEYRYRSTDVDSAGNGEFQFRDDIVSLGLQIPLGAPPQQPEPAPQPAPAPAQPLDSDGDGVIDANDQCPGTPRGTEVDARGCPIEKEAPIVLRGVTFEFDSSRLTAQAENRLDNVVDALKASPDVAFRAEGYTDSIGTEAYNQALSQRRVDSVKEYLVNHGISASRMTTVGYGESNPVATNETAAGRAQNRRVELHVTEQ